MESFFQILKTGVFFKKIKKIGRKAVKRGLRYAKQTVKGVAAKLAKRALRKLRPHMKWLIKRVVKFAIGKLPKKYQGMANLLRKKLGYEISEELSIVGELDTIEEIGQIQQEFDLFIANILMTDDETKHELFLAEIINVSEQENTAPLLTLDNARDQFIEGIVNLKEGEDPAPVVESFLPAVMWAVKLGLKFYGRPKLVNYLAKYVARLISRYVGRRNALSLSKVLVSAGLRLVNLETTEQEETQAAGEAVASIVEETLYEVAKLPEYILDDEALLEGFVLEAFEKAASRNLPEVLPEETYVKQPHLRESKALKGTWVRKFKDYKRLCYKKNSSIINTKLPYHKLQAIKSFAETPLSEILQNQYGLAPGADLEAMVHLYEATPGTTLPQISQYEDHTPGLGQKKYAYTQLHPLTPEVAGMLFGEPGLGRSIPKIYLNNRRRICVGQRFYYLEIPEAQLQVMPAYGSTSVPVLKRPNGVKLTLDFSHQQIRFYLFLSESNAQNITVKLRQKLPLGSVLVVLKSIMEPDLKNLLATAISGQLKIIHEVIPPQQIGNSFLGLPQLVKSNLEMKLIDWLGKGLTNYFRQQSQEFISATEDLKDGVTIKICLDNPPDFTALRKVLKGSRGSNIIDFSGDISIANVKSIAGYYSE